jgi:hypothetical protein
MIFLIRQRRQFRSFLEFPSPSCQVQLYHILVYPRVLLTLLFISTFPCLNFLDDGLTFPRGKHQRKNNGSDSVLSCSDSALTTFLLEHNVF